MPITQQILNFINIEKLKGISDIKIDFQKPLTGILGVNGSGKSTIIHALACVYKPLSNSIQPNYKLSYFFTPTTHTSWAGSKFTINHTYRENAEEPKTCDVVYSKASDRWVPRYATRLERNIIFCGVRTVVPAIELETQNVIIKFSNTEALIDVNSEKVKEIAGYVMNRSYENFNQVKSARKTYIGVKYNAIDYSALAMGAGEQRIFSILREVVNAPKNSLILIDEIDLLLHKDALIKLLEKINEIATDRKLQIVFTTHSHEILNLDFIDFYHLYQTAEKTLLFKNANPDVLKRLTGENIRPIEIFVEDDLSETLVHKIASQKGHMRSVDVSRFGAAGNCFTAVGGAILTNQPNVDNMLFVLDGDVYRSEEEKQKQIGKAISGDDPQYVECKEKALKKINQYNLPEGSKPEEYYHQLICNIPDDRLNDEEKEIQKVAKAIHNEDNSHKYITEIIETLGYDKPIGLTRIVDILAKSDLWNEITKDISEWIDAKVAELNLEG